MAKEKRDDIINRYQGSLDKVFDKCVDTLESDIDQLTPKERVMLWKDLQKYFEQPKKNDANTPGMNMVVQWKVFDNE